jgi:hypothetical protein
MRVLIAVVVLVCSGCTTGIVSNTVENKIEERLPSLIGPAGSYKVKVHGSDGKMIKGRIKEILIHGEDAQIIPDLRLDTLDVKMTDVVADRKGSMLKRVGKTSFNATISELALNEYLACRRPERPKIELIYGKMIVRARPKVLRVSTDVNVIGFLVANGKQLDLKVNRLEVAGLNTRSLGAKILEDWINPVLDLKSMKFSVKLTSVAILPGEVHITGTADLVGKLSADSAKTKAEK